MEENCFLQKVVIFATRKKQGFKQLLTIEHPTAGLQVPAGSVEPNELPLNAAKRELFEETSLHDIQATKFLGVQKEMLPEDKGILLYTRQLSTKPTIPAKCDSLIRRGYQVWILGEEKDYLLIKYEEYDYSILPYKLIYTLSGWVEKNSVARSLIRYFYHFSLDSISDFWNVKADGHTWKIAWRYIDSSLHLISPQDQWLESFCQQL